MYSKIILRINLSCCKIVDFVSAYSTCLAKNDTVKSCRWTGKSSYWLTQTTYSDFPFPWSSDSKVTLSVRFRKNQFYCVCACHAVVVQFVRIHKHSLISCQRYIQNAGHIQFSLSKGRNVSTITSRSLVNPYQLNWTCSYKVTDPIWVVNIGCCRCWIAQRGCTASKMDKRSAQFIRLTDAQNQVKISKWISLDHFRPSICSWWGILIDYSVVLNIIEVMEVALNLAEFIVKNRSYI